MLIQTERKVFWLEPVRFSRTGSRMWINLAHSQTANSPKFMTYMACGRPRAEAGPTGGYSPLESTLSTDLKLHTDTIHWELREHLTVALALAEYGADTDARDVGRGRSAATDWRSARRPRSAHPAQPLSAAAAEWAVTHDDASS